MQKTIAAIIMLGALLIGCATPTTESTESLTRQVTYQAKESILVLKSQKGR